jgi:hypothetical protein
MSEAVIVALIGALATVIGVIISNRNMQQTMMTEMDKKLAVHETAFKIQIEELTREVREHNNFAKRVPVIEEQIKVANHRIEDLERGR